MFKTIRFSLALLITLLISPIFIIARILILIVAFFADIGIAIRRGQALRFYELGRSIKEFWD